MSLIDRLDTPLFALLPRLIDRRKRTAEERAQYACAHQEEPFSMANNGQALDKLPVVSFFKLIGIVSAGVTPIVLILFLILNGMVDRKIGDANLAAFRESDARYLSRQIYDVRHDELVVQVREMKAKLETAEAQRLASERQLFQILAALEQIKGSQATAASVAKEKR